MNEKKLWIIPVNLWLLCRLKIYSIQLDYAILIKYLNEKFTVKMLKT